MRYYNLVIVDDDPDDRDIMKEVLEAQGSDNHLILSSAEAVFNYLQGVQVDEHLPRLIMTDLNMPGISGMELLRILKSTPRYAHIEVLVFSTSSLSKQAEHCLALGAKEYVTKPSAISGYMELAERLTGAVLN
jgi:CheY-like chemotaxis protein